ncbi:MAG: hypothetical protein ACI9LM_002195 [Alteromonadaceae bacterium]|jgi:uncharacterized protein (TIGR02922 family)
MDNIQRRTVTVIYYREGSLELVHEILDFDENTNGRVIIPESYKEHKSIIAVCNGEVDILNKMGDRILPVDSIA